MIVYQRFLVCLENIWRAKENSGQSFNGKSFAFVHMILALCLQVEETLEQCWRTALPPDELLVLQFVVSVASK